jgi:hypothetical protein
MKKIDLSLSESDYNTLQAPPNFESVGVTSKKTRMIIRVLFLNKQKNKVGSCILGPFWHVSDGSLYDSAAEL